MFAGVHVRIKLCLVIESNEIEGLGREQRNH